MVNVVLWLGGKIDAELAMHFARHDIRIVDEGFENAEDFASRFDVLDANVDVVVIADTMIQSSDRKSLFARIRESKPNIRIVIIFPGHRSQYIDEQIAEYRDCDIIYEGNGLDADYFADVIRKGYIEESAPDESASPNISGGILGLTHGCGVTSMSIAIAEHLAPICRVKAIDLTGTASLRFAKSRGVTCITHTNIDIPRIKSTSRAVVIDFGAPFELSPKGKLLATSLHWGDERMKLLRECDLKLVMCFADRWHIGKLRYLKRMGADDSWLILLDRLPKAPRGCKILTRNDRALFDRIDLLMGGESVQFSRMPD